MQKITSVLLLTLIARYATAPISAFEVKPETLEIHHPRQPHSLQVFRVNSEGFSVDLRHQAKYKSADTKVATVDESGWITPVGNGQAKITIAVEGQTKTIEVKVSLPKSDPPISFRHDVMPVFSLAGCNMGGCHGYSLGKNGFKLSLRGQDAGPDFNYVAQDSGSRRVNIHQPEASLLIGKAVGDVPHEGGVRFRRGSLSHQILRDWIAQGCPSDLGDKTEVVGVRVTPDRLILKPGEKHHLQLIAEYSNGTKRDVTKLAVFSANNDQFATVDESVVVKAGDAGETAIVARFERTFAACSVLVLKGDQKFTPTPVPSSNFIDKHVVEKLNRLKVRPSALSGDEEFLRRVYLDMIGVQPKPEEIKAFLGNTDPKKREKAIDALFERPEFVDYWSLKWGDLLQNSRTVASQPSVYLFREFIRSAVASNLPVDQFARKILTARGSAADDPASVYFAGSKDANDTVERATQVFCGVRMLCARCHTHPAENWTQADYYGLASFFNQVSVRQDARFQNVPNAKTVQLNLKAGFAVHPRTGQPQPVRFLGGVEPKLPAEIDRRIAYADWLTSPKNPFFARGLTNRIWSYFFHRGIIDPVDDIRSTNPPINPALLDTLTEDFVAHKFDLRHLIKQIVTSETYQRGSQTNDTNRYEEQNFSRAIPRRIPAEALLDSLVQATAVNENFAGVPGGFRAAQLPDGSVENDFLKLFGKPARMDACECERDNGSNMLQALHFLNGKSILGRVQNPGARPALLVNKKLADPELIQEIYLWSLARRPTESEQRVSIDFLKSYGARRLEAVQDMMWALLNSRDFLLVH